MGSFKTKTPPERGFYTRRLKLFDFSFFVDNVLTYNRIVLFQFHFSGLVRLFFVVV